MKGTRIVRLCYRFLFQPSVMTERNLHSVLTNGRHVVAACQFTATNDKEKNFEICQTLIRRASELRAEMVFLPENFDYIGTSMAETMELADDENGEYIDRYRQLARELKLWLSLGGFHEKDPTGEKRSRNAHLILNDQGETVAKYHKLHLFDIDIKGQIRLKESDFTIPGRAIVPPAKTNVGNVGLATCYDLRFPEQAQILRKLGADILTYPSAFTVATGMAHWEALLRARAIETQCYVVAAAQTGKHNEKRVSYGHSMIIDPWGTVIAQCSQGTGVCVAEIDLGYVQDVRQQVPCYSHRRGDLYGVVSGICTEDPDSSAFYTFGQLDAVPKEHVFLRTPLSFAFVNRKPVTKGHVLVSPLRPVCKLTDMTVSEIADMFSTAQLVLKKLEECYGVTATTLTVQDGPVEGKTVQHVHIHLIPHGQGDFNDKEIYKLLATPDKGEEGQTGYRHPDDMAKEAIIYRKLFNAAGTH